MSAYARLSARLRAAVTPAAIVPDRRRDGRHTAVFQIAKLTTATIEELCILRDVSSQGMKIESYSRIPVGETLTVTLRTERTLAGTVVWAEDGAVGVRFASAIALPEMLAHCSMDDRVGTIRPPRIALDRPAQLHFTGGPIATRLCDVSQQGMKVVVADPAAQPGAPCGIAITGLGLREAVVRWRRGDRAGIQLDDPIPYPDFVAWRLADASA